MTQSATQPQPLALDPVTHAAMLCTTMDALPFHPRATAEQKAAMCEAARIAIGRLRPRDPLEAMLAARIVAFHAHIMDDLQKAAQADLPPTLQLRFEGRAMALARMMDATVFELRDRQTVPARRAEPLPATAPALPMTVPALPAAVPAPDAEPAPEAALASTPPQPVVEGRHARRRRERAERHAARAKPAGLAAGGPGHGMHERLVAEVAARAAASITALAA
jgi:hypothetical protein